MGFPEDFSFDFNYDPYSEPDYSSGFGGGGDSFTNYQPPAPPRTPGNNYNAPSGADYLSAIRRQQGPEGVVSRDLTDYYNPDSPEWQKYTQLAASRPESESIIGNYLQSMPTRSQYEPGTGRKIAGFLLGTLAGAGNPANAGRATSQFLDAPYLNAFQDWKNKGTSVNTEARLLDAARGRELQSLKYGLDKGAMEVRQQALDKQKAENLRLTVAGRETGFDRDAAKLAELEQHRKDVADKAEAAAELARKRLELAQERFDWEQNKPTRTTTKPSTLLDLNKQIGAYASEEGVPNKLGKRFLTTNEIASQAAIRQVLRDYPGANRMFSVNTDENGNEFLVENPGFDMPQFAEAIKKALKTRTQNILKGQFR